MKNQARTDPVSRRNFLRGGSVGTVLALMGGVPLKAQLPYEEELRVRIDPPIKCAVIGCGLRGREILTALGQIRGRQHPEGTPPSIGAPVIAVCDTYPAMVRRAKELAPKAEGYSDYKQVLANKDVQAVFVATPTHQHKEIVCAALAAGKHVYCEAPLAHTVEDARTIAKAAQAADRVNFQPGLQMRADPQHLFLLPFIRSGAIGTWLKAYAQWHKKTSWRRSAPTPEREQALNWRLSRATSPGLIGECGIHQVDKINWYFNTLPVAVTGFGNVLQWKNEPDRQVPDTVQAVFEYPSGACLNYEATLGNSYEAEQEILFGSNSTVLLRGDSNQGWLFKEEDSPMFGWEVFARKTEFYKKKGIVLQVGSSRSEWFVYHYYRNRLDPAQDQLVSAIEAFLHNANYMAEGVEDFTAGFGKDAKRLKEYLDKLRKENAWRPAPTYREGFEANVVVLKANEAILNKERIVYRKEWFAI